LSAINDGDTFFDISQLPEPVDVYSNVQFHIRVELLYLAHLRAHGVPVVNSSALRSVAAINMSRVDSREERIPTPRVLMAFDEESALRAIERWVIPAWLNLSLVHGGRLLAKARIMKCRALIETKPRSESIIKYYIQEYINKPGRDIRALLSAMKPFAHLSFVRKLDH